MSLVSSRLSLTHTCTVERNTTATTNARGNPSSPDWQPHTTDVPCRAWVETGQERAVDDAIVAAGDLRMIVTTDTDVTEDDQVTDIADRGDVWYPGPLQIRTVMRHQDHIELILKRVD